jgi:hypothetical protein
MAATLKKKAAKKAAKKVSKKPVKAATPKKKLTAAQKLAQEIKKRNKLFKAADAAGKRVLIAKDVIAQIKAKRFIASEGNWVIPELAEKFSTLSFHNKINDPGFSDESAQKLFLSKKIESCSCCALGGMLMSCTLFNNHQTATQLADESNWLGDMVESKESFSNGLDRVFTHAQLRMIEVAFEGNMGYFTVDNTEDWTVNAESYYRVFADADTRLVKIMENIIKNKGTFVPEYCGNGN